MDIYKCFMVYGFILLGGGEAERIDVRGVNTVQGD